MKEMLKKISWQFHDNVEQRRTTTYVITTKLPSVGVGTG
jgi:hypothetical protein